MKSFLIGMWFVLSLEIAVLAPMLIVCAKKYLDSH